MTLASGIPRIQGFRLGQFLAAAGLMAWVLLVTVSLIFGTAYLAFRADAVPAFEWRHTMLGRHSLVLSHSPVCLDMPGLPPGACADYVTDLNEIRLTYQTPNSSQVLVSTLVH